MDHYEIWGNGIQDGKIEIAIEKKWKCKLVWISRAESAYFSGGGVDSERYLLDAHVDHVRRRNSAGSCSMLDRPSRNLAVATLFDASGR